MSSAHYLAALAAAETAGVALPLDPAHPPSTPWAPSLRALFDDRRRVVHEERLIDVLLTAP